MKKVSTYRFRFDGAPRGPIENLPVPGSATLSLRHSCGALLSPKVAVGDTVKTGSVVAESEAEPGLVVLSPVTGEVTAIQPTKGKRRRLRPGHIAIRRTGDDEFHVLEDHTAQLEEISAPVGRSMLVRAGMWPLIGHYPKNGALPDMERDPNAVVVKAVKAEPFTPRGHILLAERLDNFIRGLGVLQRVVGGLAKIHLVITAAQSTLAQDIKERTLGKAWIKLHYLPVAYPVENDGFLHRVLFADEKKDDDFVAWYVDIETVMQMRRALCEGIAPCDRVIALGGNGFKDPIHVRARLGMSINDIVGHRLVESETRLVRGGLLTGTAVADTAATWTDICDQSISAIAEGRERTFLGFARPGKDVDSFSKTFLSFLQPDAVKDCSTDLRGEPRLCVCCGYCEEICPAGIMPHQLYKCASKDLVEEVEALGIDRCIECGLCSYVCPSKIEILSHLIEAKTELEAEKAEMAE